MTIIVDVNKYKKQRKLDELKKTLARKQRLLEKAALNSEYGDQVERLKKEIKMLEGK